MKIKALIVDDEPLAQNVIIQYAQKLPDLSIEATCNEAICAHKVLQEKKIDLLFLDINMPIMDGWLFLEEFIKLPITHKIRINILTSSIDQADRENWRYYMTRTHHIIDYKNKPIQKKEIEEITRAA